MDNRKILDKTFFTSYYFNPSKDTHKKKKDEGLVDFYILYKKYSNLLENICAFHTPYSCVSRMVNSDNHNESEEFIMDIISHQNLVQALNNDIEIEGLYLCIMEYLCCGNELRYEINSCPDGGCGIILLFAEDYHYPSITSFIPSEINKEKFHL